jgi:hypothetical protein
VTSALSRNGNYFIETILTGRRTLSTQAARATISDERNFHLAVNPNGVVPTRPCSQSVLSERGKSAQSSPFESHLRNPGSLNLAEMEE